MIPRHFPHVFLRCRVAGFSRWISTELAAFLESGLSIVVATRDADLQPDGAVIAWAARVRKDGKRLTVYLARAGRASEMLRNLEQHPGIAFRLRPADEPSRVPVKGNCRRASGARDGHKESRAAGGPLLERPERRRHPARDGGLAAWPCVAFEIEVTQLFEQTPGRGTGGLLP